MSDEARSELFPDEPVSISNRDKLECIEREIRYRERVYTRRWREGKMTLTQARREIAIMRVIAAEYRAKTES